MNEKLAWFVKELTALAAAAEASGVVLTIDNVPGQPLAMGNHRHRVAVREARLLDTPIRRPVDWSAIPGVSIRPEDF